MNNLFSFIRPISWKLFEFFSFNYSPEELGIKRVEPGINCKRLYSGITRTEILCRITYQKSKNRNFGQKNHGVLSTAHYFNTISLGLLQTPVSTQGVLLIPSKISLAYATITKLGRLVGQDKCFQTISLNLYWHQHFWWRHHFFR